MVLAAWGAVRVWEASAIKAALVAASGGGLSSA
jgi:hypothetical protein